MVSVLKWHAASQALFRSTAFGCSFISLHGVSKIVLCDLVSVAVVEAK